MKEIKIPDSILNQVKARSTELNDIKKEMFRLKRKAQLSHDKLWDVLADKLPETAEGPCTLNLESMTIKIEDVEEEGKETEEGLTSEKMEKHLEHLKTLLSLKKMMEGLGK